MTSLSLDLIGATLVLLAGAARADWTSSVASYAATRDGTNVAAGATLASGDNLEIVLAPPDEPEALFVAFYLASGSSRQGFEFDNMPIRFEKDLGANVWRTSFRVPYLDAARTVEKNAFSFDVLRYGADMHSDGQTTFRIPYPVAFAAGTNATASTALRVYDFGPNDGAVLHGAKAVTRSSTPDDFTWTQQPWPPNRWDKAAFGLLDSLMHDWATCDGGEHAISFRLALPAGRWKASVGFGGFGLYCWLNGSYQPPAFTFTAGGTMVYSNNCGEAARFAFRDHEADPDEDLYETYMEPVLQETRCEVASDGSGVEFSLKCLRSGMQAGLAYVAVWPADDAAAEAEFEAILERRRMRFNSLTAKGYATDRYSLVGKSGFEKERARVAEKVPLLAALDNPHDWVPPTAEPNGVTGLLSVRVARGEKASGVFFYRPDEAVTNAVAAVKGLPEWARAKVYRLMNYRFIRGSSHENYIVTNHLLEGPRPTMNRGVNYSWCLRVDVPDDAPAGTYRGTVEVSYGKVTRSLPAELVVYGVNLPALDDYRIGLMGGGDGSEAQMRFAKEELGATSVHLCNGRLSGAKLIRDAEGRITGCSSIGGCTVEELDRRFKTYAKVGFPCKAPYCGPQVDTFKIESLEPFSDEWTNGLAAVLRTILAVARSNGCESVSMDLGGEIGHDSKRPDPETVAKVVRYLKVARALEPGIEYTWRCNCMDSTTNFYPLLDYACIRGTSWNWTDAASDFGRTKRLGVYSMGGRYMNGVFAWYHGAKGSFREWLAWSHALEFNEFLCQGSCGGIGHSEAMMGPSAEGGFTVTQRTEAWRAGIDDIRYLKLLDATLADATGSERERLAAFRSFLRDAIRNSWVFCRFSATGGPGHGEGLSDWPYLRMDVMREVIVRFVTAHGKGETADLPDFPSLPTIDTTTYLALDDGPLNYAGTRAIGGQLFLPSAVANKSVTLTLTGEGIDPVALPLSARGFRLRQVYYISGTSDKIFTIDGSDLRPGTYDLTLSITGAVASVSTFTLIRGERQETTQQTIAFAAPYADEREKKLVNAVAVDPVVFDASANPVDADHAISFSGFDAFDDSVTILRGGWWNFGACAFLADTGGGRSVTLAEGAVVSNAAAVTVAGTTGTDNRLELRGGSSFDAGSMTLGWKNGSGQRSKVIVSDGSALRIGGHLNLSDTKSLCNQIALTGNELVVSNAGSRLVVGGTTGMAQQSWASTNRTHGTYDTYGAPGGNRLVVTDGAAAELQNLTVSQGNAYNVSNRVTVSKGGRLATRNVYAGTSTSFSGFTAKSWNRFEVLDGGAWTNAGVFRIGNYQFATHDDNVLFVSNGTFRTKWMCEAGNNCDWLLNPNTRIVISGSAARFVVDVPSPIGGCSLFGTTRAVNCQVIVENGAGWTCPVPVGYMQGPTGGDSLVARTGGTLRFPGSLVTGANQCSGVLCTGRDTAVRAESDGRVVVGNSLLLVGLRGLCDVCDGTVEVTNSLSVGCWKTKAGEHYCELGTNCILRLAGTHPSVRAQSVTVVNRTASRIEIDLPSGGYAAGVATSANPLIGAGASVKFGDDARLVLNGVEDFCRHQRKLRRRTRYVLARAPTVTVPEGVLDVARQGLPKICRLAVATAADGESELSLTVDGRTGAALLFK